MAAAELNREKLRLRQIFFEGARQLGPGIDLRVVTDRPCTMPRPVLVRSGQIEFVKLNTPREWRDLYQWLLGLNWPKFSAVAVGTFFVINLIFATLYALGGDCIAGMRPGSFSEAFFFSVQTLATVGYGHMYPQTLYGDVVSTVEITCGLFSLAVMTGLIFVRFSRPRARIVFSK